MKTISTVAALVAGALLAFQSPAIAQTATVFGSLGNFDVANNQEQEAHGFELELEGVQATDVADTYGLERYSQPTVTATPLGVVLRWASPYDAATRTFLAGTQPHVVGSPLAGACYPAAGGAAYDSSGCEHFGVTLTRNAARTTYRWLVADPLHPGALVPGKVFVSVATPNYSIAAIAAGAVLNADVTAPAAAAFPTQYGDAHWVKIYRRQLSRSVLLQELLNTNTAIVPENAADVEVSWTLVQADPLLKFKAKTSHARIRNSTALAADTQSVVRRYEMYTYTGKYDPVFHQARCADFPACAAPQAGEVGEMTSAQMTAANLARGANGALLPAPKPVTLSVGTKNIGVVVSVPLGIACPGACSAKFEPGTTVTVIAVAPFGGRFLNWSGACTTAEPKCTFAITKDTSVQANFSK